MAYMLSLHTFGTLAIRNNVPSKVFVARVDHRDA